MIIIENRIYLDLLSRDGDMTEKAALQSLIFPYIPNYAEFRFRFVQNRMNKNNPATYKKEISDSEKKIWMCSFSILRNLFFVQRKLKESWFDQEVFEYLYFRLGSAIDLVEEFYFWILVYTKKIDLEKISESISQKIIEKKIQKNKIRKDLEKGMNITLPIANKFEFIKNYLEKDFVKDYKSISGRIKTRRNIYIHSYKSPIIEFKESPFGVLGNNLVSEWAEIRDWSKFFENCDNDEYVVKNIKFGGDILNKDFRSILRFINGFWGDAVSSIKEFEERNKK